MNNAAASSSSSSYESFYSYDVFISFRGPDTRRRFIGYLYLKLCEIKQARIFLDDRTIEPGDLISETLIKAIQESRIGLVVFSPDYASSTHCLNELENIIDLSIDQKRMFFLPVFYDVEPTILRHQKGSYEEALIKHEARFGMQKINEWKAVLEKAAGVSGFTSNKYRYDSDLISDIAQSITKKISKFREGEKNQRIYNVDDDNIARQDRQLKLLKTLEPNDPENEKPRGDITLEVLYKPFKEDELPTNEEDPNAIEKAPEGTPASGGLLVIIIREAEDVEGKHHTNPYARLIFKGEERKTKHVKKNRDPRWGETFQFMLEEPPTNDRLYVEVQSASSKLGLLHPKETLGYVDINLSDVVSNKRINEKYHLIDSKNGRIQIELQWRTP